MQLNGVRHQTVGPCFPCDTYGEQCGLARPRRSRATQRMPRYGTGPHDGPLQEQVKRWHEMYLKEAALAKRLRGAMEWNAKETKRWNEMYVKQHQEFERLEKKLETRRQENKRVRLQYFKEVQKNERLRAENEENAEGRDYWNDLYLKQRKEFERLVARLEKENAELRGASSDHTRNCPCYEDQRFEDPLAPGVEGS